MKLALDFKAGDGKDFVAEVLELLDEDTLGSGGGTTEAASGEAE